jgi:hypothetical protein
MSDNVRPVINHKGHTFIDVGFTKDEEHWPTVYRFNLSFLLSRWGCTFGGECKGTYGDDYDHRGCCAGGVEVGEDELDEYLSESVAKLTDETWQNRQWAIDAKKRTNSDESLGFKNTRDDLKKTRMKDEVCVFFNQPGFPAGTGCAFHVDALVRGENPYTRKPVVCALFPIDIAKDAYEFQGISYTIIGPESLYDWIEDDATWFCLDDPGNYQAENRTVLESFDTELRWQLGDQLIDELNRVVSEIPPAYRARIGQQAIPSGKPSLVTAVEITAKRKKVKK